jgi:polyisoprenoid-binding protein YceI
MNAPTTPSTNTTSSSSSGTAAASATRWTLDPGHSTVGFSVRHLMITNVRGVFRTFRGDVTYDPAHPEATRFDATIDVGSIDTREAKRDSDLKSEIFFDAAKYPEITFVSKHARATGEGQLEVTGDLTTRGTAREVVLAVHDISGVQVDMRGNQRIGATATARIKRSDFGMTWNKALETGGVVVGDVVTITLDVSLVKSA